MFDKFPLGGHELHEPREPAECKVGRVKCEAERGKRGGSRRRRTGTGRMKKKKTKKMKKSSVDEKMRKV